MVVVIFLTPTGVSHLKIKTSSLRQRYVLWAGKYLPPSSESSSPRQMPFYYFILKIKPLKYLMVKKSNKSPEFPLTGSTLKTNNSYLSKRRHVVISQKSSFFLNNLFPDKVFYVRGMTRNLCTFAPYTVLICRYSPFSLLFPLFVISFFLSFFHAESCKHFADNRF